MADSEVASSSSVVNNSLRDSTTESLSVAETVNSPVTQLLTQLQAP